MLPTPSAASSTPATLCDPRSPQKAGSATSSVPKATPNVALTTTVGVAISGYSVTGRARKEMTPSRVTITEITGSESFIHLDFADARWVMLTHGIRHFEPDEVVEVFIDPRHLMVFDAGGQAARGPMRAG